MSDRSHVWQSAEASAGWRHSLGGSLGSRQPVGPWSPSMHSLVLMHPPHALPTPPPALPPRVRSSMGDNILGGSAMQRYEHADSLYRPLADSIRWVRGRVLGGLRVGLAAGSTLPTTSLEGDELRNASAACLPPGCAAADAAAPEHGSRSTPRPPCPPRWLPTGSAPSSTAACLGGRRLRPRLGGSLRGGLRPPTG